MQLETFNMAKVVHLHCLMETIDDVNIWLGYFTHLKFGFTNKIAYIDHSSVSEKSSLAYSIMLSSKA